MAEKVDYKKKYKDLYLPKQTPVQIQVPVIRFLMADGTGDLNGKCYYNILQALYALTFTVKMSKMGTEQPQGYFQYVVPPLEGLWVCGYPMRPKDEWN